MKRTRILALWSALFGVVDVPSTALAQDNKPAPAAERPAILPAKSDRREVSAEDMRRVYEQVKTPFKYGVVLRGETRSSSTAPASSAPAASGTWSTSA